MDWFQSYLQGRTQRVTQRQEVTPWKDVTRGVPQGSCLSPLLFNIFVRELPAASPDSSTVQFADDITNSEADKDIQVVGDRLTKNFLATKEFCDSHGLVINTNKTQLVVFKSIK